MNKWIEEKGGGEIDQILEGHGTQFVVRFVSYSQPQCWRIKESPFLLDVQKRFANLSEAKEYCERRYKELFGPRDETTRLRADLAAVTEERDRLREALRPLAAMDVELLDDNKKPTGIHAFDAWDRNQVVFDIGKDRKVVVADLRRARAAIEGVTEPPANTQTGER